MSEGREAARAPLRQRSRRRWTAAGGVAVSWAALEIMTGSFVSATVLLVAIAGLGAAAIGGLRALGITWEHPWLRRMASRPWRDGQDVLRVAMRHLSDVFVITPSGTLLAPNVFELHLNPDDLASLRERMELGVISASLAEVYREQVCAHKARLAGPGGADAYVIADESVPPGRYRLRQGQPVGEPGPAELGYAEPGPAELGYAEFPAEFAHVGAWQEGPGDMVTVMEGSVPPVPVLRLVTGSSVAETVMSGARAGRGAVELVLPEVPTVSREHATFTFSDGRWWVTNQGRNGLTLNGVPVAGEQPLSDGDAIRWGVRPDAPLSRVEIG
jgi:hypothetical protein